MAVVKSYAVGVGDMFYIRHNSDNFTIIDCQLFGEFKESITDELKKESSGRGITRFISTHPDEDHIQGLEYLDEKLPIYNFYVAHNAATKKIRTESFKHYCKLRDGDKAFYVYKGCSRKWMNLGDGQRSTSGIQIHWPNRENAHFKAALQEAADGTAFNNISLVARYAIEESASFMWIGDLETQFMEDILDDIELPRTTVVFAPHHGRYSGKLPNSWLDKLQPEIVVLGEAPSRDLHYYTGYNTLTQTRAWDITFVPDGKKVHCYVSNPDYEMRDWLDDEGLADRDYYIGTLNF
ncbi:hypothetical protein NKH99_04835 [Mesorhizobium sp. M0854]|uniref:hypothetical protein n=1 Tax=unclassified Mesorhizobium TaxID=325217 RepID=UPI00333D7FEB